ncbi:recombinase family protein [Gemella cuniculi]|uniref:recombinase family protein n=1 Tax=Gemella cuniculi TaxID=150240 RepID=UPI00247FF637|nr:recombinase family protein [Gemella cuniculi]
MVVRLIYDNYFKGISAEKTEKQLDEMGIPSPTGKKFPAVTIRQILKNINYTGNLLLQKEYIVDPITKRSKKNRGELPMYFVENNHEPIISKELFDMVQEKIAFKRELGVFGNESIKTYPFTTKIQCAHCKCNFRRKTANS